MGKSGLGPRGDVILEADWCIGEFMKTLEEEQLLENTLIIFSSDNGPVLNDGYYDESVEKNGNHKPAGPFRGGKYSLFAEKLYCLSLLTSFYSFRFQFTAS